MQAKKRETVEDVRIYYSKFNLFQQKKLNQTLSLKFFFDGWYEKMRFEKFYSIRGFRGILRFENFFREGAGGDFLWFEKFFEVRLTVRGGVWPKCHTPVIGGRGGSKNGKKKRQLIFE